VTRLDEERLLNYFEINFNVSFKRNLRQDEIKYILVTTSLRELFLQYHSHLYLQAVKLKLATPLSRLQVGLRARPLKAPYLVNSFFGR
jgi:hypothetical protein